MLHKTARVDDVNPSEHSGNYLYHLLYHSEARHFAHTVYLLFDTISINFVFFSLSKQHYSVFVMKFCCFFSVVGTGFFLADLLVSKVLIYQVEETVTRKST
jgi:hypothetical protein